MKAKFVLLIIGVAILLASWQTSTGDAPKAKKGMVKIAIMYPNEEGKTFNMDYYSEKHMPMCARLFGDSLQLMEIDKGVGGRTPDEPVPYVAIGYFYFNKLSEYQNSFGPNAEQILGDIPNYTDIQPVVQISEVVH
ncbi:EthD family reductase [Poritiphilus flavus]|uniref:EthD family reductase n=1 Tax=Poritiphilus flavus TaxID=2697053 RepID=A0A6L9EC47_9FLAO|nr:EthD family reductase [Poritiphilus flavus]NAS12171.1 EthD family reductase [Poritiphilus flavus]